MKFGGKKKDAELAALDRGVLEVALMIAALDGEILPSEYAAFEELAKTCRGYTAKAARACLDSALKSAGYLIAISQVGCYDEKARLAAFVEMATAAMPKGFACGSMADLRRAFALWVAMGVSDGGFSDLERKAVEALRARYAEFVVAKDRAEREKEERLAQLSPMHSLAYKATAAAKKSFVLGPEFIVSAEKVVKDFGVASKREKAIAALDALVNVVSVETTKGVTSVSAASIFMR